MPIYKKDDLLLGEAYEVVLEAKDHTKTMVNKLGFSEHQARVLQTFYGKYSIYFAKFISNLPEVKKKRDTEEYNESIVNAIKEHERDFTTIMDWVKEVPNIRLNQYPYEDALEEAKRYWYSKNQGDINKENNKILKDYGNGWYWVDLECTNDDEEGEAAGHCGGTDMGSTLWSLRNKNHQNVIKTWVTVAISPEYGTWYQAKGPRNSRPKLELFKYIADIFIQKNITVFRPEYQDTADFNADDFKTTIKNGNLDFDGNITTFKSASDLVKDEIGRAIHNEQGYHTFTITATNDTYGAWLEFRPARDYIEKTQNVDFHLTDEIIEKLGTLRQTIRHDHNDEQTKRLDRARFGDHISDAQKTINRLITGRTGGSGVIKIPLMYIYKQFSNPQAMQLVWYIFHGVEIPYENVDDVNKFKEIVIRYKKALEKHGDTIINLVSDMNIKALKHAGLTQVTNPNHL